MAFSITDTLESHNADCHYAECRDIFIVVLNVVMPSVIMLNVKTAAEIIKKYFFLSEKNLPRPVL
jgi:hypothetical protein